MPVFPKEERLTGVLSTLKGLAAKITADASDCTGDLKVLKDSSRSLGPLDQ